MPLPAHLEQHLRNLAGHQQYDHGIGADEIATNYRTNPANGQREQIIAAIKPEYEGRFAAEGWMVPGQPRQSVDNITNKMIQMLNSPDTVGFVEPRSGNQKFDKLHFCATDPETGKKYWIVINPNDPTNGGSIRRMRDPDKDFNKLMENSAARTHAEGGRVYDKDQDGKFKPVKGGYEALSTQYNNGAGKPLAENTATRPSDKLQLAESGQVRVATPEERAAHANGTARPQSPAAPAATPDKPSGVPDPAGGRFGRVAGAAAIVLTAMAAANAEAAAENRPVRPADVAGAIWNNSAGGALAQNRKMEAVMRLVDAVDMTQGYGSGALRKLARDRGADVDPGILENCERMNPEQMRRFKQCCNLLAVNARDQFSILQEAGLANIKDGNGQRVDIGAILRDPDKRETFINKLKEAHAAEKDPTQKEKLQIMIAGANRYVELQGYREAIIADARATVENPNGKPGAPLPQSPMAPIARQAFKTLPSNPIEGHEGAVRIDPPLPRMELEEPLQATEKIPTNLLDPSTFVLRSSSQTSDAAAVSSETEALQAEKTKPVARQASETINP